MTEDKGKALGFSAIATPHAAACILCIAGLALTSSLTNAYLYAAAAGIWGLAREIATLTTAAAFLCIGLAAQRRPRLLAPRALLVGAVACYAAMALLVMAGIRWNNPALLTCGLVVRSCARVVAMLFVIYGLLGLPGVTSVAGAVVFGVLVDYLVSPLLRGALSLEGAVACIAGVGIAVLLVGFRFARDPLALLGTQVPADDLAAENPRSFIASTHALFLCVLLFSVGNGYALTFNEVDNAPVPFGIEGFLIMALVFYVLIVRDSRQEDTLFSFSVLLFMAGLLMAPLAIASGDGSAAPNLLIHLGGDCFEVLLYLVIVGVGKRNAFAFVPVLGLAFCMKSLGTTIGAVIGHFSNDVAPTDPMLAQAITLTVTFLVFAFLWTSFRTFSFTDTIFGVKELELPQKTVVQETTIEDRCAALSEEWGLTKREQEIFVMLARGRNVAYIQDHYTISRNTVKSHIKHIYAKLGVHSHQELIDLVEGAPARKE